MSRDDTPRMTVSWPLMALAVSLVRRIMTVGIGFANKLRCVSVVSITFLTIKWREFLKLIRKMITFFFTVDIYYVLKMYYPYLKNFIKL